MLAGGSNTKATFTAPAVTADTTLSFKVEVSDGKGWSNDTVDIRVVPAENAGSSGGTGGTSSGSGGSGPTDGDDSGCGCSTPGSEAPTKLAPFLALGALLLGRRRRKGERPHT
jgi:MYXO-CTERM domain-containing protein